MAGTDHERNDTLPGKGHQAGDAVYIRALEQAQALLATWVVRKLGHNLGKPD